MAGTNIVYSDSLYTKQLGEAMIGKIATPLKMIIEHESDACTKKNGVQKTLFNIEKSNKFGETIMGNTEFDVFKHAAEGAGAEGDNIQETNKKFIEHIQFMKEFVITQEMLEDANYGVAADAKRRAENFVRAYHKTMNKICSTALINATSAELAADATNNPFKVKLDLTTADDKPLFSASHVPAITGGKMTALSNLFKPSADVTDESDLGLYINMGANKIRNFQDEQGEPLEYVADTIILPGNMPKLEYMVKKICGSEREAGTANNDINVQYGNWTIVVLPDWVATEEEFMLMSSEANKNLAGNMFFNRVPLNITPWVDNHTANHIWTGRCRFGVGFGSWKHIARFSLNADSTNGGSVITL